MTQANSVPEPHADGRTSVPYLDCERLDCYRVAVEFQVLAAGLGRRPRLGSLRDQLDRASVSIVLNIAEGAGRTTGPDKAHFFAIARGSATESAAVMDLLLARGLAGLAEHRHARGLLVRIVSQCHADTLRAWPAWQLHVIHLLGAVPPLRPVPSLQGYLD